MKTRVYKFGHEFYPQYRRWFVWRYIYQGAQYPVNFATKEKAVEFLTKDEWHRFTEVVWESK